MKKMLDSRCVNGFLVHLSSGPLLWMAILLNLLLIQLLLKSSLTFYSSTFFYFTFTQIVLRITFTLVQKKSNSVTTG